MMENIDTTILIASALKNAGYVVFLNKNNPWGLPMFHVQGTNGSKPDLLAIDPRYEGRVYGSNGQTCPLDCLASFAIETKTGDHLQDLPQGREQLETYWKRFTLGQVRYYTDRGTIHRIDAFLFATRYSPAGYLYKAEPESTPRAWDFFTDRWQFLEYLVSKFCAADLFHGKQKIVGLAARQVTQEGRALAHVPEIGILKAGIRLDGRVTKHLRAFLPSRVVKLKAVTWSSALDELHQQQIPA